MRPLVDRCASLLVLAFAVGACSKETNVTTAGTGGTGGGGGTGGSGAQATLPDCSELASPTGTAGAPMVKAGRTDGTCFHVDQTEATRGDYEAFLTAPDKPAAQDVPCAWNATFEPDADCEGRASVTLEPDHPMVCIDQCDALAFCEWAGKTLCTGEYAHAADPKSSSVYAACSRGGADVFPYGKSFDAELCNGADNPDSVGTTVPVTQGSACATSDGVRGLSGNVYEMTAECDDETDDGDACRAYGGSFKKQGGVALACEASITPTRATMQDDLGFRCCAYAD